MRRRWVALAAACLMVAGCGGGEEGKPVAAAPVEEFEPCSIPAAAIEATGLNPEILGNGWGEGIQANGWTRCLWESADRTPWYLVGSLVSSQRRIADLYSNTQYSDLSEIEVGGRTWLQYSTTSISQDIECGLAFDTVAGMVTVDVTLDDGPSPGNDPCAMVLRHAEDLAPYFPPQN